MSNPEEEPYSSIFASLKHPVRRKILRMLSEKPRSFSEILEAFKVSSSHLTYHLENLGELVSKTDDGKYKLSTFGEAAVATMSRVEETPRVTGPRRLSSLPNRWKSLLAILVIALVIFAAISYVQYQSLNQLTAEYAPLKDLDEQMKKGGLIQSQYTLSARADETGLWIVSVGDVGDEIHCTAYCVIYTPYDNSTLNLALTINSISSPFYVPISVQEGDVFNAENDNTRMIWSLNASLNGEYEVQLASKGYYTISVVGPIIAKSITFNGAYSAYFIGPNIGALLPQTLDCSMMLSLIRDGKYLPFAVY